MIFRQLFDSLTSTYTYLLADQESGEAIVIDPVDRQVSRELQLLKELGLTLKYVLDTHVHADHITGAGKLRSFTGAKSIISKDAEVVCADILAAHGDRFEIGSWEIEVRSTPGHTQGCISVLVKDGEKTMIFTGDALLIRGCGRTDFQQGSATRLYDSVWSNILSLPDDSLVYPGHDYHGRTCSTVGEEKMHNPRLGSGKSREEFTQIMSELHLDAPKYIDVAVPANLACGQVAKGGAS